jgi:hypothetical protein
MEQAQVQLLLFNKYYFKSIQHHILKIVLHTSKIFLSKSDAIVILMFFAHPLSYF